MNYFSRVFFILILSLTALVGCQEESEEIIAPLPTDTVSIDLESGAFLLRMSQQDGSSDNIVDGGSCTTIVFPFTVIVNGTTVEVKSEEDYDLIEDIIDELEDDTDSVAIQFPIEVSLPDHSIVNINSMDELEELLEDCIEGGLDDDIECLDIIYPITFSSYSEATEQASTTTIENDEDLYQFLDQIEDTDIVTLNYPVGLALYNGDIVVVDNNEEFEAAVELYEDSCDEDDDNDFDDDDEEEDEYLDDTDLINTLKQSTWIVSVYDSASVDKKDVLEDFEINFREENLLEANSTSEEIVGEWETSGGDTFLELAMDFDTDGNLVLLNDDWRVESFADDRIEMTASDSDSQIQVVLIAK